MCAERSSQESNTPYVAVIAVFVAVIVILATAIALLLILRDASKKKETQSQINEVDMYDLPNAKSESGVYDVILTQ